MAAAKDISGAGVGQPFTHCFSISPSDNSEMPFVSRAIWVGFSGHIAFMSIGGTIDVLPNAVAGTIISGRFVKVFITGTTASGLKALI